MRAQDVRVLAILVATNGEEWLPECIRALNAQTHSHLDVIAIDNASSDASGRMLAKAFGGNAITLDRRVGYGRACAAALKVAQEREFECDAFLLVHDDAALEPDAIHHLVEAMLADDSIGIVGGKVLEWDDPAVLQEIGMATDLYGRLFGKLERGELDHGQHDGLREVLFCTSAALLVRREVVERIGLFDPRFVAMRDDLDLCWRARLAGFRTIVATDARTRHVAATARGRRDGPVTGAARYFSERNRIATLLKNYSSVRLLIVAPILLLQSIIGAALYFARGRRSVARQIIGALEWNVVHLPSTIRARTRARRRHAGSDADILRLMVRGAPRLRGYVERVLETIVGEPVQGLEEDETGVERPPRRRAGEFLRAHPIGALFGLVLIIYLIGARSLYGSGGLAGAGLLPFPGSSAAFFREFGSGWRSAGAAGGHPPGLAMFLLGLLSVVCLGSTWLASRVLMLSLLPAAALFAHRGAARLGIDRSSRPVVVLAYVLSPLALEGFARGGLAELVLLAAAAGVLPILLSASGVGSKTETKPLWRSVAAGTAGLAIAASFSPYVLPFTAVASLVIAATSRFTGGRPVATLRAGFLMSGGAFLLLFPWSLELLRPGTPLAAQGILAPAQMTALARLTPYGSPLGPLAWALPIAAILGLVIAGRRTPAQTSTLVAVAGTGLLVAWGCSRAPIPFPSPAFPLVATVFAFAVLVGAGAQAARPELRERSFGVRHVVVGGAAVFLAGSLVAGIGWSARGRFPSLVRSGALVPAFIPADVVTTGDFRLLWVGPASGGIGVDLTGPSGETMLAHGVRRSGAAVSYALRAATAVLIAESDQGGRLLAPLGVRHIVIRPGTPPAVESALERQTDLRFRQTFQGARIFDNLAWLPVAAPLEGGGWAAASRSSDPFASVLTVDPTSNSARGLDRKSPARFSGSIDAHTSTILLGESFDAKWRLFLNGRALEPRRAFGFATAFDIPAGSLPRASATPVASRPPATPPTRVTASPSPSPVAQQVEALVVWRGQSATRLLLLVQLGMWIVFAAWWSGRRALDRGER